MMLLNTKNYFSIPLLLLFLFPLTSVAKTLWQDSSGGLHFRWMTDDIVVTNKGKPVFSARSVAQAKFTADFFPLSTFKACEYERELKLLSVVGAIASFAQAERVECQGISPSSLEVQMYSLDMGTGEPVKLTDFFSEAALLKALLKDGVVKKALADSDIQNITTLTALYEALQWADISVKNCNYYLPPNYLSQFAFYHLRKNQVGIRINLPPVDHSCQGENVFLAFYLPIPTSLRMALRRAVIKRAGFLMSAQKSIANGESTKIQLYTNKQFETIKVQRGDTLYRLASRYNSTLNELASLNHLSPPYPLRIGQVLTIVKPQYSWQWHYATPDEQLPTFTLQGEIIKEPLETGQVEQVEIKMIEISKQGQLFQLLPTKAKPTITPATADGKAEVAFYVEDVNFDGYSDLRLMVESNEMDQVKYAYWLYEPRRGRFIANQALSDIYSPEIDIEKQQIKSFWRQNTTHYGIDFYQWQENQPVLMEQEERLYTDDGLKVIMKKRIKDKLKVISETVYHEETATQPGEMKPLATENASNNYRIINTFGLNCYSAPSLGARSVASLPFGTVVKQLARSDFQEPLEQVHDYWYKIELPATSGVVGKGWIFGGYSLPLESKQSAEIYLQIAQTQLQEVLNLPAQQELIDFIARAQQEIYTAPEITAELALLQLLALEKMLAQLPSAHSPYQDWLANQQTAGLIDYDEQDQKWQVKPSTFWHLHEHYYPLAITDRMAWTATNYAANLAKEACQDFFCQLEQLENSFLKYLRYHPHGEYYIVATAKIKEFLADYASQPTILAENQVVENAQKKQWLKQLAILRATVARTQFPALNEMMQALDNLTDLLE